MKAALLLVLMSALMITSVISQAGNSGYHSLVARKNKRIHEFFARERIDVNCKEENNLKDYRGILTGFADDGIYLSSFKKSDTALRYISVSSIVSVHNLLRRSRLVSGIFTGVFVAAGILFLSAGNNDNNAADNYAGLFAILSVAGAVSGTIGFLSTFATESINTKSLRGGWLFSIQ
jgi:hypothetical protein